MEVCGIAYNSRKVEPGFLFFRLRRRQNRRRAIRCDAALQKGALAVVSDRPVPGGFYGLWLQVAHGREALALTARNFYNKPDERLAITAITGTNGKTTSSTLIDAMLRAAGKPLLSSAPLNTIWPARFFRLSTPRRNRSTFSHVRRTRKARRNPRHT